jgi:hypothetical protein
MTDSHKPAHSTPNPAAMRARSMKAKRKNGSARTITVAPSRLQKSAVAGNRLSIIVSFDLRGRIYDRRDDTGFAGTADRCPETRRPACAGRLWPRRMLA